MRLELYTNTCKKDNCFFATLNYVRFAFIIDIHVGSSTGAVLRTVPVPGISKGVLKLVVMRANEKGLMTGFRRHISPFTINIVSHSPFLLTALVVRPIQFSKHVHLAALFILSVRGWAGWWRACARKVIYVRARREGLELTPEMPPVPRIAFIAIVMPVPTAA